MPSHRRTAALVVVTGALGSALAATPAALAAPPQRSVAPLPPVVGEVIVRFRSDAAADRQRVLSATLPAAADAAASAAATRTARAAALGARIGRALHAGPPVGDRMQVVRSPGADPVALAARIAADPDVEFAVPNGRQRRLVAPNDPLYPAVAPGVRPRGPDSGQWYLRAPTAEVKSAIDIESAWTRTKGSPAVVVAVLDTGVRTDHPDLGRVANGGPLLPGYDFVADPTVANDGDGRDADAADPGDWVTTAEAGRGTFSSCEASSSSWHGTATASLVAAIADNGVGIAGAAPGVRVLPVRVLGKCFGTDADIQAGMLWAAGLPTGDPSVPVNPNPARVINMSLGSSAVCSAAYQSVVDRIAAAGVVIVAAAGNSAGGAVGTPGNCRGVVSVLALRHAGTKVGFSDLGPEISVAAPGGNCVNITTGSACQYPIVSATNAGTQQPTTDDWTDSFDISVGTSYAAPLVAAVAGLMISQQPVLTPLEVKTTLQATARPFPTTGADNGLGDPTPVEQCRPPAIGVEQLQCYCTTALCGAGMVDAGAAVAAAAGPLARIAVVGGGAFVGSPITLDGSGSIAAAGAAVTGYAWTLVDGGGIVAAFTSATNAATATATSTALGTFTVRLTVTDALGHISRTERSVTVTAEPAVVTPPVTSGGGGGGAFGFGAICAIVLATAGLILPDRGGRRRT